MFPQNTARWELLSPSHVTLKECLSNEWISERLKERRKREGNGTPWGKTGKLSFSSSSLGLIWGRSQSKARERGVPVHPLPILNNVFQTPLLAAYHTPCFPKSVRSWTLSLRLPGTPPTAALTATEQLRRMRRGQRCTSPSMEETRCVTRSLGRMPDLTRTLRAKQSMISSLQITRLQHLWLKGKRCTHKCSLTCRWALLISTTSLALPF